MKPPAIRLTFDCVVLSVLERKLHVALARRSAINEVGDADPFPNGYSLPGGYVRNDEAVAETINRRLGPEIGLDLNPVLLGVFDDPKRDPRHRVVSIAFYALIPSDQASQLKWGSAYKSGDWYPADKLPEKGWAFDHRQIVRKHSANCAITPCANQPGSDCFQKLSPCANCTPCRSNSGRRPSICGISENTLYALA